MSEIAYSSLAEFYQSSNYGKFSQEHRSEGSLSMSMIRAQQKEHSFTDPAVPELVLVLGLDVDMLFRRDIGDGWSLDHRNRSGEISFCPADTDIRYECGGNHHIQILGLPARGVNKLLEDCGDGDIGMFTPLFAQPAFRDEKIRTTLLSLWSEMRGEELVSGLMLDGLLQQLIANLVRRIGRKTRIFEAKLASQQLARIDEYIEAHIDSNINVEQLAQLTALSQFDFARHFKHTTGLTPYQYVMERRITKARGLLTHTRLPLVEIAYTCGFSSQQHMTSVFSKHLGITPGQYRKEMTK